VSAVVKDLDSHGPIIACVEWWLRGGKYDTNNTAWGRRLELYRDGVVYERKMLFHREQGHAFLRRRKVMNLRRGLADAGGWKDFRDEWLGMQKNLDRQVVDLTQAKKEK
jgi:hypothetical protein